MVTSHGMYADIVVTRFDASKLTIAIEPGGSISGLADPGLIRHRGGQIVEGSPTGFTADSSVFDSESNGTAREHAEPTGSVSTTVSAGGRVALALDPSRKHLTVRALAGTASVRAGSASLTLARGQEARAERGGRDAPGAAAGPRRDDRRRHRPELGSRAPHGAPPPRGPGPGARPLPAHPHPVDRLGDGRSDAAGGDGEEGNVVLQKRLTLAARANRIVCLALPAKARGIPVGTPLTIALGVRAGSRRSLATRAIPLTAG